MSSITKCNIVNLIIKKLGIFFRTFVFRPQSKDVKEIGAHQTMGLDLFVTGERVILLDAQVGQVIGQMGMGMLSLDSVGLGMFVTIGR